MMNRKQYPPAPQEAEMASEPIAASTAATVFNPAQMVLLRMFARDQSEEKALEIQRVLSSYFREKADQALDQLWESGELNQEKLDSYRNMHIRDILKS